MISSMLGNRPETVRKRGRTNCGGLEKEAMTLNELRIGQVALTLIKNVLAGSAGDLINTALGPYI